MSDLYLADFGQRFRWAMEKSKLKENNTITLHARVNTTMLGDSILSSYFPDASNVA